MNLMKIGDLTKEGSVFKETHPKFTSYILDLFGKNRMEKDGELEVAYTSPDGKRVSGKIKVKESDLKFIKAVKDTLG